MCNEIGVGAFFDHGVVYTCKVVSQDMFIIVEGFEEFGWFDSSRFILATELNKALS